MYADLVGMGRCGGGPYGEGNYGGALQKMVDAAAEIRQSVIIGKTIIHCSHYRHISIKRSNEN